MRSQENGVDLIRTSPFAWEDGVARMTDPQVSFVTPDYVVRLETEVRATLTEQQKAPFEQILKKRMQKLRPA